MTIEFFLGLLGFCLVVVGFISARRTLRRSWFRTPITSTEDKRFSLAIWVFIGGMALIALAGWLEGKQYPGEVVEFWSMATFSGWFWTGMVLMMFGLLFSIIGSVFDFLHQATTKFLKSFSDSLKRPDDESDWWKKPGRGPNRWEDN